MSCIPAPTRTLFTTIASTSTLTTLTNSVTSQPPVTTTIHTQLCSNTVLRSGITTCIEQDVAEVSTIPGGLTTLQVPIVIVFQITQASPTRTLFAPCTETLITQSLQASSLSSPASSTAFVTTTVTPAPSIIISEHTSTLLDGSVQIDTSVITSTFGAIPIVIPALPSTSNLPPTSTNTAPSTNSIVGPIVGGVLGGFFGLIGIVFLIWYVWKKRRGFLPASLVSEKSPPLNVNSHPSLPSGYVVEPQKYQYGHVGSAASHASHVSPPHSLYARSSQSHSHSHTHSFGHSGTQPSLTGTPPNQWPSARRNSPPTPPMFSPTAIPPGMPAGPSSANLHSSSGSSFPGYAFQNPPPSSFPGRAVALSGYGSGTDDEQSSEGHGSVTFVSRRPTSGSSRRKSHSSSPTVDRRHSRPKSSERTPAIPTFERLGPPPHARKSFSGAIDTEQFIHAPALRRRSTDATPVYEEPRSPLFVVNHTEEPSGSEPETESDTPPPQPRP